MFRRLAAQPSELPDLDRVEALIRDHFGLGADAIVLIAEERPDAPGLPPVATTVRFWADAATRYRLKIFKPVAEVGVADLPARWLLPSLIDDGDTECC